MNKLVAINLHGILGEEMGCQTWNLAVNSAAEGIKAINSLTKNKFNNTLLNLDKKGVRYAVLINGNDGIGNAFDSNEINTIYQTDLIVKGRNIETIDIIPFLEGAGEDLVGALTIVLGVILVIIGIVFYWTGIGALLVPVGIGLIVGGVVFLLTRPPAFEEIDDDDGKKSYLFSGPTNSTQQGGPIPVVYGTLVVGSSTISASYNIITIPADDVIIGGVNSNKPNTNNASATIV